VLPASSSFEKAEATFFNLELPNNAFHLRQPLFAPKEGTLFEAEIHARLVESITGMGDKDYGVLKAVAKLGLLPFAFAFAWQSGRNKRVAKFPSIALYRTLGEALPKSMSTAASLWGVAQMYVRQQPKAATNAGFGGNPVFAGNRLFKAIVGQPSGTVFAKTDYADSWKMVKRPLHKIDLWMPEFLPEIQSLEGGLPKPDPAFPFFLSAGERRTETSNTSIRDMSWHKKGSVGTLRLCAQDASAVGCEAGEWIKLSTRRGSVNVEVEISDAMQPGHVSLPNGLGLDYVQSDGTMVRRGVSLNELTNTQDRDHFVGTPWHKRVPARLEKVVA
jgi:anaerobic selenocysteine-containing dehydrogenase